MPTKTTKPSKKSTLPKYDPQKSYKWGEEDEFILKGSEFGLLYNLLKTKSAEAQATLEAYRSLHKLFEAGVTEGTIVEMDPNKEGE